MVRLGSDYGGWFVPTASLRTGGTAYCAGAGEDITFDLELADLGLNVLCVDPTPRAIEFVTKQELPENVRFLPVGLWDQATKLRFYAPSDPGHVSHSALNLSRTEKFFEAPVETIGSLMASQGHQRIDILKLDIEGAEHRVLASLVDLGVLPDAICVEFDQPMRVGTVLRSIRALKNSGYALRYQEGWNFTFERL